jgi:hypothetical protein
LAESITAALIAAGVLGLWFSATRGISVAAVAILAFIYPWLVFVILFACALAVFVIRLRK